MVTSTAGKDVSVRVDRIKEESLKEKETMGDSKESTAPMASSQIEDMPIPRPRQVGTSASGNTAGRARTRRSKSVAKIASDLQIKHDSAKLVDTRVELAPLEEHLLVSIFIYIYKTMTTAMSIFSHLVVLSFPRLLNFSLFQNGKVPGSFKRL